MSCCLPNKNLFKIIVPRGVTGLLALLIGVAPAIADQFDTVNYIAKAGIIYDDNVFRLPSDVDPLIASGNSSKSDQVRFTSLGLHINKYYSNQEVILNADVTSNQYNTFSFLDYNSTAYKAAWNWRLSPWFGGVLSKEHTQTLNDFADIKTFVRNLNTVENNHFDADWWFQSNWHVLLGTSNIKSTSSVTTINNLSYLTNSGEIGLKYSPDDGRSVSLISRYIQGNYIDVSPDYVALLDNSYTERQQEIQFRWQLTGKSTLGGNLIIIDHQYPLIFQRDYTGIQGGLNYLWSITGKTSLNIALNRKINPWWGSSSSYFVADTVSISPSWQLDSKIVMYMSISNGVADYLSPIVANAITRNDVNQSAQLGVDWTPQRTVTLSASVQKSSRSSNNSTFCFDDNTANLSLQIAF